jgi:hypothetical protein
VPKASSPRQIETLLEYVDGASGVPERAPIFDLGRWPEGAVGGEGVEVPRNVSRSLSDPATGPESLVATYGEPAMVGLDRVDEDLWVSGIPHPSHSRGRSPLFAAIRVRRVLSSAGALLGLFPLVRGL